jgi:hypothetical protein
MIAIVVVPLAHIFAARRVNRRVAQRADGFSARSANDVDACTVVRLREPEYALVERRSAVVKDDQLTLAHRLPREIGHRAREQRQSTFLGQRETAYHPRSPCRA